MFASKRWWNLALLLTLIGIGVSAFLTYSHYSTLIHGIEAKSACNISQYFNCDMVLNSRFSKLWFAPLAGLGLLFYFYVLGALIYAKMEPSKASTILKLPFILILLNCGLTFFLAYESTVQIRSLCLYCTSLYVVNFGLAVVFFLLVRSQKDTAQTSWIKKIVYLAVVFLPGLLIFYTIDRQFNHGPSAADLEKFFQEFFSQTPINFDIEGRPFWGNPDAKVVLVEFSHFECPICKRAAFSMKPILGDFQDQVKVVFMNYPLDQSCNNQMPRELHLQACQMARAGYCAQQQGHFWEFNEEAFQRQPNYGAKNLENIAQKSGLDLVSFQSCLQSEDAKTYVQKDIAEGVKGQIQGTPTVFANGRPLPSYFVLDPSSKESWKVLLQKLAPPVSPP